MSDFYKDKNLNCTMEQWEKVAWSYGKQWVVLIMQYYLLWNEPSTKTFCRLTPFIDEIIIFPCGVGKKSKDVAGKDGWIMFHRNR